MIINLKSEMNKEISKLKKQYPEYLPSAYVRLAKDNVLQKVLNDLNKISRKLNTSF